MFFQKNSKKLKLCLIVGLVLVGSILIKWFGEYITDSVAINTKNNFVENNIYSDFWMCPTSSTYSADFINLFTEENRWKDARSRVDVFQFYSGQFYNSNHSFNDSDAEFIISKLNQWNIDIALEAAGIKEWNGGCDASIPFNNTINAIERIQNYGGTVKYISMQEPFFSAHRQQCGCGHTIKKAAEITVNNYINPIKARYPDIIIGDIEPYSVFSKDELKQWIIALEKKGYKLPFFHLDVDANRSDMKLSDILDLQNFCQNRNIQFGIIFWNNDQLVSGQPTKNDQDFYESVMRWGERIFSDVGTPNNVIIQSWEKSFIQRNLPDNSGYSFSQLVKDFTNFYIPVICNFNHTDSTGKCNISCGASARCNGITPGTCSSNPLKKCNSNCHEISSCKDGMCNCGENLNNCPEDCKGEKLSADLNCDGSVNLADAAILLSFWNKDPSGATSCQSPDINQDGNVNLADFAIIMSQWTTF